MALVQFIGMAMKSNVPPAMGPERRNNMATYKIKAKVDGGVIYFNYSGSMLAPSQSNLWAFVKSKMGENAQIESVENLGRVKEDKEHPYGR